MDATFRLVRRFYAQLFTASAIAGMPWVLFRIIKRGELTDPMALMANRGNLALVFLVSGLAFLLVDSVLIVAVSDGYLTGEVDIARSFTTALRKILFVIIGGVLRSMAAVVGMMAVGTLSSILLLVSRYAMFVIAPVMFWLFAYVWLRTFAVTTAILLEDLGPVAAIRRSWRLTEGSAAHVFYSGILVLILGYVVDFVASMLFALVLPPATAAVFAAVILVAIYPLFSAVWTLVYYDLRIRKEGFDLEVMSRELGTAPAPLPAT